MYFVSRSIRTLVVGALGGRLFVKSFQGNSLFLLSQNEETCFECDITSGVIYRISYDDGKIIKRVANESDVSSPSPEAQVSRQKTVSFGFGGDYSSESSLMPGELHDALENSYDVRRLVLPNKQRHAINDVQANVILRLCDARLNAKDLRQALSKLTDKVPWNDLIDCRLNGSMLGGVAFNFTEELNDVESILMKL